MTINYPIEFAKACIESDVDEIKKKYQIDVSAEIGMVLNRFVSYWKKNESEWIVAKFLNVVHGLEKYLTGRMYSSVNLNETVRSGSEICKMLEEQDTERIKELEKYLSELSKRGILGDGIKQLSAAIPDYWLNRGK